MDTVNKKKRRIPLPVKIILGILIAVVLIGGGFAAKLLYEQSIMSPLPTGEVISGVYAVNNGFVNFYLIKGGEGYLMIDAGNNKKQTTEALAQLGISPDEVQAVLLTHSDGDHVSALSIFTNAQIYLPEKEVQMIDGTTSRNIFGGNRFTEKYQTLANGETITIGGFSIECILTPGHTPGSMCYLIDGKYLFTGDSMSLKDGEVKLFNSFYNMDDEAQKLSLYTLASAIMPEYIFTAHYGYSDDPVTALAKWVL